jgi:hypothetical protein
MTRTALLTLLLVLTALTTPSTTARDSLIIPGQRIGPWTLTMTVGQFAKSAGRQIRDIR